MNTLVPMEPVLPAGFSYANDFISNDEERALLGVIEKIPLQTFTFQGYKAKRKFASFGYDYNFERRTLTQTRAIPEDFGWLMQRAAGFANLLPEDIAELLIFEYPAGAVINWHRDAAPFHTIMGISLLADCIFKLRPQEKAMQNRSSLISVPVHRRSIYVLADAARTDWQHSTAPTSSGRYSITLRTLRHADNRNR